RRFICSPFFYFQAEDGIRGLTVTGVQTCALPIFHVVEARGRLGGRLAGRRLGGRRAALGPAAVAGAFLAAAAHALTAAEHLHLEIGRASCRERVDIASAVEELEKKRDVGGRKRQR